MADVAYGKTPLGQLLYDLAFSNCTEKWLARKHRISIASVRRLRSTSEIKKLRRQNRLPATST